MEASFNVQRIGHLLDDGRKCSLRQLQDYLDLSERQVRRLLQQMTASGLIVHTERQNRHKFFDLEKQDQRTVLPDTQCWQAKLLALTLAIKASQGVLAPTQQGGNYFFESKLIYRAISKIMGTFVPDLTKFGVVEGDDSFSGIADQPSAFTILADRNLSFGQQQTTIPGGISIRPY